jgi:hypothetical protein
MTLPRAVTGQMPIFKNFVIKALVIVDLLDDGSELR